MTTTTESEQQTTEREHLLARIEELEARALLLDEQLQRVTAEKYSLYLTSLDISGQLDLQSTLEMLIRRAIGLVSADNAAIYLMEEDGELVAYAENGGSFSALGHRVRPGQGAIGRAAESGQPVIVNGYSGWEGRLARFEPYAIQAVIVMPLFWQTRVIGTLVLSRHSPGATFSTADADSLQLFVAQASIAIHHAQLYAREKSRNKQLAMLYRAAIQVTESLDMQSVLNVAVDVLTEALSVPACIILQHRPPDEISTLIEYQCVVTSTEPPDSVEMTFRKLDAVQFALRTGQWTVVQRDEAKPSVRDYMTRKDIYSMLLVPMALGQRSIGMIGFLDTQQQRRFSGVDVYMAQALTAQVSVAIRHAQLHGQLQSQRVRQQTVLLTLIRRLLETHDQRQVAQQAIYAVIEAFDVPFANLIVVEGNELRSLAAIGWQSGSRWNVSLDAGINYAIARRETIVVDDALSETRYPQSPLMTLQDPRSAIIAPMVYRGMVVGVMTVARYEPFYFSSDDGQLLSLLAYQTAVALERARLFESVQAYAEGLEQKVIERTSAIYAEQERVQAILDATGESLVVFDRKGCIYEVNRAFKLQHGYDNFEVIGKTDKEILGVELLSLANYSDPYSVWRDELLVERRDGSVYDAAVTLSRIFDGEGTVTGVVASLRDISHLKELNRIKSEFVSNVSHELRTPLANMKLYQHLLENGMAERRPQYLATMRRETERLQNLIEDLLMLSRLDLKRAVPNLRPVSVHDLLGDLVRDRSDLAAKRNLALTYEFAPGNVHVLADPMMLTQAVTNLLDNAMNYTVEGSITVSTQVMDELVQISVTDTGLGIAPEEQTKLFDRFFRGEAAQQTGAVGTGLGMAIVKEIIQAHNGTISVTSKPDKGSTFTLSVPKYQTESA
jgi:PAS domain S-box-containing protein